METMFFLGDDDPLNDTDQDIFMSLEEVQLPSSCGQVGIKEPHQQVNLNFQELSLTDLLLTRAQAIESEKLAIGLDHLREMLGPRIKDCMG